MAMVAAVFAGDFGADGVATDEPGTYGEQSVNSQRFEANCQANKPL
jgi:hypothetical protein